MVLGNSKLAPNKRMQSDKMDVTRHFAADAKRYVASTNGGSPIKVRF